MGMVSLYKRKVLFSTLTNATELNVQRSHFIDDDHFKLHTSGLELKVPFRIYNSDCLGVVFSYCEHKRRIVKVNLAIIIGCDSLIFTYTSLLPSQNLTKPESGSA